MRVLHVIDSLTGSGGAERGMAREIVRFSPSVEQALVCIHDPGDLADEVIGGGVEVASLGIARGSAKHVWPAAHRALWQVVQRRKPDILHTSLYTGNVVGQSVAWRAGIPVLSNLVLSGDPRLLKEHQPGASTWRASVARSIGGLTARRSKATFRALTHDTADTNARLLRISRDLITIIPRGVPMPPERVRSRVELGLPEDRPLIVTVGRLARQKGHVHLVRALVAVKREAPEACLVIVGPDGDAADEIRRVIDELDVADDVVLVGYSDATAEILAHADVFGFASLMEGLGTAVIEAMINGAPVVAFDIPPVREVVADGVLALLVPVGDSEALAEGLLRGLHGELEEMAGEARKRAHDHHSIEGVAHRVERLLVRTASGDAGAGLSAPG